MRFVVACDGSDPSLRALRRVLPLAQPAGAALDLVHVIGEAPVSPFVPWAGLDGDYVRGLLEAQAEKAHEATLTVTRGAGAGAEFRRPAWPSGGRTAGHGQGRRGCWCWAPTVPGA